MILLDTHVVVWLHLDPGTRVPARVRDLLEADEPVVPSIVRLELQLLHEIGRLRPTPAVVLDGLRAGAGIRELDCSAAALTERAAALTWTRDPFDRLIAAHALLEDAPLVTKDERLREHLPLARWDES